MMQLKLYNESELVCLLLVLINFIYRGNHLHYYLSYFHSSVYTKITFSTVYYTHKNFLIVLRVVNLFTSLNSNLFHSGTFIRNQCHMKLLQRILQASSFEFLLKFWLCLLDLHVCYFCVKSLKGFLDGQNQA